MNDIDWKRVAHHLHVALGEILDARPTAPRLPDQPKAQDATEVPFSLADAYRGDEKEAPPYLNMGVLAELRKTFDEYAASEDIGAERRAALASKLSGRYGCKEFDELSTAEALEMTGGLKREMAAGRRAEGTQAVERVASEATLPLAPAEAKEEAEAKGPAGIEDVGF